MINDDGKDAMKPFGSFFIHEVRHPGSERRQDTGVLELTDINFILRAVVAKKWTDRNRKRTEETNQ